MMRPFVLLVLRKSSPRDTSNHWISINNGYRLYAPGAFRGLGWSIPLHILKRRDVAKTQHHDHGDDVTRCLRCCRHDDAAQSRLTQSWLESDNLVRQVAAQGVVELREAACSHPFNGPLRRYVTLAALFKSAFG